MEREDKFSKYMPIARAMAARYATRAPTDYDEMLSAAYLGLVKAVTDGRRISRRYVEIRVVGEIKDAIRRVHPMPRRDAAFARLYHSFPGNLPERAGHMGMCEEYVFRRMARVPSFVKLDNFDDIPDCHRTLSQLEEAIEVCLPYVPEEARDVFLRKFQGEQSLKGICKDTNLSISQAHDLINLAVSSLQEHKETLANLLLK